MKRKLAKFLVTENQADNKFLIFFLAFDVRLALLLTHVYMYGANCYLKKNKPYIKNVILTLKNECYETARFRTKIG